MLVRSLLTATAAGLVLVGTALPAAAAPGETTLSVTVTGGSLEISVPAAAGSIGSRPNTVTGGVISGLLGQVQVTDARSAGAGATWVTSVIATAFTASPSGNSLAASLIGYTAGTITKTGTANYTANNPTHLEGVIAAVSADGITGDNSATWNPTINVTIPAGTPADTYPGTITHSVV